MIKRTVNAAVLAAKQRGASANESRPRRRPGSNSSLRPRAKLGKLV